MAFDPKEINDVSDVFLIDHDQQAWLRGFPMLTSFGVDAELKDALLDPDTIPLLDGEFWQTQTEAIEKLALTKISDLNIDGVFYEVTSIIDEDPSRFDPMIHYFRKQFPEANSVHIETERNIALCVKRDLSWMMVEWLINAPGFFTSLKTWYDLGRWPHGWDGKYPSGRVLVK